MVNIILHEGSDRNMQQGVALLSMSVNEQIKKNID